MSAGASLPRTNRIAGDERRSFLDALEANDGSTLRQVAWKLWNCGKTLPNWACDALDVPRDSSYAQGARRVLKP
jgi:hypothetical protein